jgi:hypothetical protein
MSLENEPEVMTVTSEQSHCLAYSIAHFQEVARRNRFPENNLVEHEAGRCVICHPELAPLEPFAAYLEVVAQSVKVRRPRLDRGLVDEINKDLALVGSEARVTLESLAAGDEEGLGYWSDWIREALTTGLDLLSIHSPTSLEFSLEEAEEDGLGALIREKITEIMDFQKLDMEMGG